MNITRITLSLALLATVSTAVHAGGDKTRAQVRDEYAEAVRTGDVLAPGDTGLKLNELYPQRYPHAPTAPGATREQVKAEYAEAVRSGDVMAGNETGLRANEAYPQRYPAPAAFAFAKTREQVKAETLQAIRDGDMIPSGEGGATLAQEHPQRYGKPRAVFAAGMPQGAQTDAR